jgi:hypothetical protein
MLYSVSTSYCYTSCRKLLHYLRLVDSGKADEEQLNSHDHSQQEGVLKHK